jgi:serine O-acetyltransferase
MVDKVGRRPYLRYGGAVPMSDPDATASSPPPREDALDNPMTGTEDRSPPGMGLWALFREDWRTHGSFFAQGLWAVTVNRLGNRRMAIRSRLLRAPVTLLYHLLYRAVHWTCRIELPYIVQVGRRVRLWHHGGCVLGARAIGDDVQIRHNVTLGLAGHGDAVTDLPIIEERVIIGAGAAILGRIRIGHDSVIGANSVVTKDVPPHSVVGGIPGQVLKTLEEGPLETEVRTKV